eukprot:9059989-Karenia_brevis.AAC.1
MEEEIEKINAKLNLHDSQILQLQAAHAEAQASRAELAETVRLQGEILEAMQKRMEAMETKTQIEHSRVE